MIDEYSPVALLGMMSVPPTDFNTPLSATSEPSPLFCTKAGCSKHSFVAWHWHHG